MAKTYVVNDGNRLLMPSGEVIGEGEEIELDDDLAERLSERITLKVTLIDAGKTDTAKADAVAPIDVTIAPDAVTPDTQKSVKKP